VPECTRRNGPTHAAHECFAVVASDDGKTFMRGMGRTVSPRAFGHNGAGGQIAWIDPDTGISLAYLTNGLDQNVIRESRRTTAIASLAAVCAAEDN